MGFGILDRLLNRIGEAEPLSEVSMPSSQRILGSFSPRQLVVRGTVDLKGLLQLPSFCWGNASSASKGWKHVTFPEPLSKPSVMAVGNARSGAIIKREIARVGVTESELKKKVKDKLGDWGLAGNWMRDLIASASAKVLKFVFDIIVGDQIDEVRDRANEIIGDFYQMVGLGENTIMTPIHVRSVSSTGFDWLSLGASNGTSAEIQWLAIGE